MEVAHLLIDSCEDIDETVPDRGNYLTGTGTIYRVRTDMNIC